VDANKANVWFDDGTRDVIRFPDRDVRVTRVGPAPAAKPAAKKPRTAPPPAQAAADEVTAALPRPSHGEGNHDDPRLNADDNDAAAATTALGASLVAVVEGSVAALEAFAATEGALDERRLEAIVARLSTIAQRLAPSSPPPPAPAEPAAAPLARPPAAQALAQVLAQAPPPDREPAAPGSPTPAAAEAPAPPASPSPSPRAATPPSPQSLSDVSTSPRAVQIQPRRRSYRDTPDARVGRWVEVWWPAENAWFPGLVHSRRYYHSDGSRRIVFRVNYDDGDSHDEVLQEDAFAGAGAPPPQPEGAPQPWRFGGLRLATRPRPAEVSDDGDSSAHDPRTPSPPQTPPAVNETTSTKKQAVRPETTRLIRPPRKANPRFDLKPETLLFRRAGKTRELALYVARTPHEEKAALALLKEGFPNCWETVTNNATLVCLSDPTERLKPISAAAVFTPHLMKKLRVRLLCTASGKRQKGFAKFLLQNLARLAAQRSMPQTFVEALEREDAFWDKCGFARLDDRHKAKLHNELKQSGEDGIFDNTSVVQAGASFEFHVDLFQLRKGSKVVFAPVDPKDAKYQGTIVDIKPSENYCRMLKESKELVEIVGDEYVFDIRPADYGTTMSHPTLPDPCAICQSEIAEGAPCVLQCGHAFHADCLQELGKKGQRLAAPTRRGRPVACPICRESSRVEMP